MGDRLEDLPGVPTVDDWSQVRNGVHDGEKHQVPAQGANEQKCEKRDFEDGRAKRAEETPGVIDGDFWDGSWSDRWLRKGRVNHE